MRLINFLKSIPVEMGKVTWPKGPELVSYTITVVATVTFVAVFFFIVDLLITQFLNLF